MDSETEKPKPAEVDLASFDELDEVDMVVSNPVTGEPTSWVITFAGPGHPLTIEQSNRLARETKREEDQKEAARVNGRKWKPDPETADERRARNVRWISERIVRWTPVKFNGEELPFSLENANRLLLDPRKPKLFQQCLDFLAAERSFTKRAAAS